MSFKLSVDVLQMILDNVDKADLAAVCQVNKVCCSYAQDILYRDIIVDTDHRLQVCQTLARSAHLAKRVRSFVVTAKKYHSPEEMAKALRNMTSLRILTLHSQPSYILDECTFELDSFAFHRPYDSHLNDFLYSQPNLAHLEYFNLSNHVTVEFKGSVLPNLTRVSSPFFWLPYIIPGRPVSEVNAAFENWIYHGDFNLNFFTLSTAPIRRLAILYCHLDSTPEQRLASIFPSLVHLTVHMKIDGRELFREVRAPFFQFPSH
jgi:hypothetical protein